MLAALHHSQGGPPWIARVGSKTLSRAPLAARPRFAAPGGCGRRQCTAAPGVSVGLRTAAPGGWRGQRTAAAEGGARIAAARGLLSGKRGGRYRRRHVARTTVGEEGPRGPGARTAAVRGCGRHARGHRPPPRRTPPAPPAVGGGGGVAGTCGRRRVAARFRPCGAAGVGRSRWPAAASGQRGYRPHWRRGRLRGRHQPLLTPPAPSAIDAAAAVGHRRYAHGHPPRLVGVVTGTGAPAFEGTLTPWPGTQPPQSTKEATGKVCCCDCRWRARQQLERGRVRRMGRAEVAEPEVGFFLD